MGDRDAQRGAAEDETGVNQKLSEYIRQNGVSPSVLTEADFWTIVEVADAHGMGFDYIHTRAVDDDVASYAIEMLEACGL